MAIKVYLQGGLGNQLFMIFVIVSYAIDKCIPYKILSHVDKTMNGTMAYWNNLLEGFKDNIDNDNSCPVYHEPGHEYNQIPDTLADANTDCQLLGYFQSHKYFEHNFDKICEIMKLRQKQADVYEEYKHLFAKKTIAMHFRLGDYLGLQMYHCIKRPDYYIPALQTLQKDLEARGENICDYNILCFFQEHDKPIVSQILSFIQSQTQTNYNFVDIPSDIEDWKQMLLMSMCDHFIIANSTFSWFGAYFSGNINKLVYYPRVWFGPALLHKNIKDICPDSWIGINA